MLKKCDFLGNNFKVFMFFRDGESEVEVNEDEVESAEDKEEVNGVTNSKDEGKIFNRFEPDGEQDKGEGGYDP